MTAKSTIPPTPKRRGRPPRAGSPKSQQLTPTTTSEMNEEAFPNISSFLELEGAEELAELFWGVPKAPDLIRLLGHGLAARAKWQKFLRLNDALLKLVQLKLSAYGPIPAWMVAPTTGEQ